MSEAALGRMRTRIIFPWMFGAVKDLSFFFLPVIWALALLWLGQTRLIVGSTVWASLVAVAFGAGPFHQGPTWFSYFDRKNRENYLSTAGKRATFFWAPPVIFGLTLSGMFLCPVLIMIIYLLWTIQHLVQQNVGILLLYHNHHQGEAVSNRHLEINTQWGGAILFFLLACARLDLFGLKALPGLNLLIWAVLAWLVVRCSQYLLDLARQVIGGASLNVPALMFWLISVLCMLPCAVFGKTFFQAFLGPLVIHWSQYIGLNLVLVQRKYGRESDLLVGARPLALFFGFCGLVMFVSVGLILLGDQVLVEWQQRVITGIILGLGLCHYFLDAFIWRFREPYQRQAILPYLLVRG